MKMNEDELIEKRVVVLLPYGHTHHWCAYMLWILPSNDQNCCFRCYENTGGNLDINRPFIV